MSDYLKRSYYMSYIILSSGILMFVFGIILGNSPIIGFYFILLGTSMYFLIQLARYLKEGTNEVQKPSES